MLTDAGLNPAFASPSRLSRQAQLYQCRRYAACTVFGWLLVDLASILVHRIVAELGSVVNCLVVVRGYRLAVNIQISSRTAYGTPSPYLPPSQKRKSRDGRTAAQLWHVLQRGRTAARSPLAQPQAGEPSSRASLGRKRSRLEHIHF